MKEKFVTITGFNNYCGEQIFAIGRLVRCEKEPDNPYDAEAIRCTLPVVGKVGYIANSVATVAVGTMSAGRVLDKVTSKFYVRVMFRTCSKVICRVEDDKEPSDLNRELYEQCADGWEDGGVDVDDVDIDITE